MPNNLAALRTKRRFSQSKLAESVGVTVLTLGRWERGETCPRKYNLDALCEILECTEEDLGFSSQTQAPITPPSPVGPLYDPNIPQTIIELVGREADLDRIKGQLLTRGDGSVALSALNGIPGVGKTSLAIAIAHDAEIRASFKDGILWAAMGPNPNIPGLLNRWAKLLGLPEATFSELAEEQKRQVLRETLGTRAMLLVLDDVWKLEDAHVLLIGGANCASLLTTRFPTIASGTGRKNTLHIEELDTEHSLHLLHNLAPGIFEHAPDRVRTLVQDVGGLPLALTLLGNYLRPHSYNVPARRAVLALESLNDPQTRLQIDEPHVQAEAHPSIASSTPISLQRIIAVSDGLLTPAASATLYALSVFPPKPESFSEGAALAIASSAVSALDELVDAGLLECNGNRYRLHRIIADYARLQIDDQCAQQLIQRLIAYMQHYVESHARDYELLEQELTLLLYTLDRAVTDASLQSLGQGQAQSLRKESLDRAVTDASLQAQVVLLVCVAAPFLLMRGYYQEMERFLDRAYEVARASQDPAAVARVLLYLGELDEKCGNISRAKERYSLARQAVEDHAPLQGILLHRIGHLTWREGDYREAEMLLREGLAFARKTEQAELLCNVYKTLAALLSQCGERGKAETYAREGLVIARTLQDRQEIVALMINLGCCLDTVEKMRVYREALPIAREIKSNEQCCLLLLNIGNWYVDTGEFLQSEPYLHEALRIARQIGHRQWVCAVLLTLTNVFREKKAYEEAKAYLQEGFTLAKELALPRFLCIAWDAEGHLALAQLQGEAALHAFQEMCRQGPQGDVEVEAFSCYGMARSYEQMGQYDQARYYGERALALVQDKRLTLCEERIRAWYTRFLQPVTPTDAITCICCGNTFVRLSGPGRTKQYCSNRCANRARKRTERQRRRGITDRV